MTSKMYDFGKFAQDATGEGNEDKYRFHKGKASELRGKMDKIIDSGGRILQNDPLMQQLRFHQGEMNRYKPR